MNNLIKNTPINLPKEVSYLSKSVYQANSAVMIKKITDINVVVNSIHTSINQSIADKGFNMAIEDMNYLKRSITQDILRNFYTLTLEDINLCFKMGVRGELGEYFGLSVVSFYGWLKKYKQEVLPKAYSEIKKFLPSPKEVQEVVDYKKLDLEKVDNICSAISLFNTENTYEFNDFGNVHYNFLDKLNYFDSISDDDKSLVKEDAKASLISKMKDKNLELIAQGKKYQKIDINDLCNKIEYGEKDTETMVDIIYRKLILKSFIISFNFDELEKFRSDLLIKIEQHYEK
jgi:hypothetical protein